MQLVINQINQSIIRFGLYHSSVVMVENVVNLTVKWVSFNKDLEILNGGAALISKADIPQMR